MASKPLMELVKKNARPRLIAGERRAAKFGVPEHETDAARAASFKRAIELCEWAMSEFIRAGHDSAARAVWRAIDYAEAMEKPQEETSK